ncbi:MAG: nucleotide-binding protein [Gallionella sp.]|nr:nucleotide-binding protein [Gallionella sp.]
MLITGTGQIECPTFLSSAIDEGAATKFKELGNEGFTETWMDCRDRQVGHLEGLAVRLANEDSKRESSSPSATTSTPPVHLTKKVFVVHGHDNEAKETVARFIERLRLTPVILHEQPNSGRTIIEKFEVFSDVGFAVVLLTPDDIGAPSLEPKNLKSRARQNVILELGYFMGKLSRFRVCALYKQGVEMPSDYQGVLYIEMDSAGAWKKKLAQELVEANLSIDLDGLLHA